MLVQSANGEIHLLPALPDVWPTGSITGVRAHGGFEIVELSWKDGEIEKAIIKSNLGGYFRIRLPHSLKLSDCREPTAAAGVNPNPFYFVSETPAPIISDEAKVEHLGLQDSVVYDLD